MADVSLTITGAALARRIRISSGVLSSSTGKTAQCSAISSSSSASRGGDLSPRTRASRSRVSVTDLIREQSRREFTHVRTIGRKRAVRAFLGIMASHAGLVATSRKSKSPGTSSVGSIRHVGLARVLRPAEPLCERAQTIAHARQELGHCLSFTMSSRSFFWAEGGCRASRP